MPVARGQLTSGLLLTGDDIIDIIQLQFLQPRYQYVHEVVSGEREY